MDARVHYTVLTQHPTPPSTTTVLTTRVCFKSGVSTRTNPQKMDCCPRHPTVCQHNNLEKDCPCMCLKRFCYRSLRPAVCFHSDSTSGMTTLGSSTTNPTNLKKLLKMRVIKNKLLRKEVIQPHLPVRLPCYDFVPIADPTFDSSLTSLGHWLRVLPTFMT